ncbi:hypothetical protein ACHAWF_013145 [Thalassiosira exigua]
MSFTFWNLRLEGLHPLVQLVDRGRLHVDLNLQSLRCLRLLLPAGEGLLREALLSLREGELGALVPVVCEGVRLLLLLQEPALSGGDFGRFMDSAVVDLYEGEDRRHGGDSIGRRANDELVEKASDDAREDPRTRAVGIFMLLFGFRGARDELSPLVRLIDDDDQWQSSAEQRRRRPATVVQAGCGVGRGRGKAPSLCPRRRWSRRLRLRLRLRRALRRCVSKTRKE